VLGDAFVSYLYDPFTLSKLAFAIDRSTAVQVLWFGIMWFLPFVFIVGYGLYTVSWQYVFYLVGLFFIFVTRTMAQRRWEVRSGHIFVSPGQFKVGLHFNKLPVISVITALASSIGINYAIAPPVKTWFDFFVNDVDGIAFTSSLMLFCALNLFYGCINACNERLEAFVHFFRECATVDEQLSELAKRYMDPRSHCSDVSNMSRGFLMSTIFFLVFVGSSAILGLFVLHHDALGLCTI
jgi:hypothetical protein